MTQEKQAADRVGLVELFDRIERRASEEGVLDALALSKLKEQTVALFRAVEPVREALAGVIRVADRKTKEFDAARAALDLLDKIGTKP